MATLIKKTVNGQPRLVDVSNPTPDDMIAPTENGNTSAHAYSAGAFAKVKGVLRKVLSPISAGQAFTDTNSEATSVGEELARINTDLSDLKRGSVSATIESSDTFKSAIEKIINLVDITKITPKTILKIGAFCYHVESKRVDSSSTYQIDFQSIVYPGYFIVYEARFGSGNGWFYINGVDKSSSTVRSESLYSTADEISLYY